MIYFDFRLDNPWSDRWDSIWLKHGKLPKYKYKAWEFNGYKTHHLVDLSFRLDFDCDHAGINVMLGLFGYGIELCMYDTRHWNYENNCWETHERTN